MIEECRFFMYIWLNFSPYFIIEYSLLVEVYPSAGGVDWLDIGNSIP